MTYCDSSYLSLVFGLFSGFLGGILSLVFSLGFLHMIAVVASIAMTLEILYHREVLNIQVFEWH